MYIFNEISKVEDKPDGTIKVYGYASAPVRDAHGEIVTAEAMRNAVADYMKYPAVREMHNSDKAAGRGLEITFDDNDRSVFVAHVVDSEAIRKVKAGVYSGFSIGGKIKKRNSQDPSIIQRIDLMEISLVDRPSCPDAKIDLWKRDDVSRATPTEFPDKVRWADGFDDQAGDAGDSSGPMSPNDRTSQTPPLSQVDDDDIGGDGSDPGEGTMFHDPGYGQVRGTPVPNSTVNTSRAGGDTGPTTGEQGSQTGGGSRTSGTGGGENSSSADYFSPSPGNPANLARIFEMISEMYSAQAKPPIEGAVKIEKRAYTVEQRRKAARSGAAMKDGSYPIENRDDLAQAIRNFSKSKYPAATKDHIMRRATALGAMAMVADAWKSAESEGGLNNKQRSPTNIEHVDGDNDNLATRVAKTDDLLKTTLASLERLEVRTRRGVATPEAFRLAKAYKAMSDDELAEVLAADAIAKVAANDGRVSNAETLMKQFKDDNAVLLKKLAETNDGLEQLQARVQKLAEMPMPTKTAGSVHALGKNEDMGGPRPLSGEDLVKAQAAYEALSEEERVLLLTKVSLANPRRMNLDPIGTPPQRSIGGTAGRENVR